MIDPLHRRRIPSGRRLARALVGVLRAMRAAAVTAIRRGQLPNLDAFTPALVRAVLPVLSHEYNLGRGQASREVRGRHASWSVRQRGKRAGGCDLLGGAGVDRGRGAAGTSAPDHGGRDDGGDRPRVGGRIALATKAATPFATPPSLGVSFDLLGEGVPLAVQQLALALAGSITEATRDDVRRVLLAGLQAGSPVAEIARGLAPIFGPHRAAIIAQTEASRSMHRGEMDYAREIEQQTGLTAYLTWLASSDACEKCKVLNGETVRSGEPFYIHARGNSAYRIVYHPPLHPSCMCSITTDLRDDSRAGRT